ncbi:MAG: hypothetical protein NUW09_09190 [Deltaproteobacteria bacterium]|nr:hypothetical protein [Deltaproteobacteria bacterium]
MLTDKKPIEYFREKVEEAVRHQRVGASETAEFYLSSLLAGFIDVNGAPTGPLAITYLKALESNRTEQERLLKQLGDISLFTSGFFSDSLNRKLVDIDYYIAMGMSSYGSLAAMRRDGASGRTLSGLFSELAEKFKLFVDVLTEVSEAACLSSSKDILRLYERWLRTGSRHAETLLRKAGIEPVEVSVKPVH